MSARAREQFGEAASSYLCSLAEHSIVNLDKSLELVIRGWLESNGLTPAFFTYEAISQYPVTSYASACEVAAVE
jgi:LPS sulfotransferase NodH